MPGTLKNQSEQLITKLPQKLARIVKQQMKPKHFPPIPTMANGSLMNRIWKNRGAYAKLGKLLGESQVGLPFCGLPQGKNYSRGIGDAWHPSKTKVGSCYNHKTNPEIGKKNQTSDSQNIFLLPLIPTKARTTKLAQKLEKHPKPIKTMFNQWAAERTFV